MTRGSSHWPLPRYLTCAGLTPFAARIWARNGAASPPSGMKSALTVPCFRHAGDGRRFLLHRGAVEIVALDDDDPAAGIGGGALQRRFDDAAIGVGREQRGEGPLSLAGGVADDPFDVVLRQEADEVDAARGRRGVGGEGDDRHSPPTCRSTRRRSTDWAKSGPRISLAPWEIAWLAAARAPSAVPRSSLTRIWMPAVWNSRMREVGGVAHVAGELAGIAGRRQRQEQRHLDGAVAEHLAGHRLVVDAAPGRNSAGCRRRAAARKRRDRPAKAAARGPSTRNKKFSPARLRPDNNCQIIRPMRSRCRNGSNH